MIEPIHSSHKEVTEERYQEMLDVLPPIYLGTLDGRPVNGFAVSEPYTHDRGSVVCSVFYKRSKTHVEEKYYETHAAIFDSNRMPVLDVYSAHYRTGYIAETWNKDVFIPDLEKVKAFMLQGLPVNPTPFLNELISGCRKNGPDWLKTDEAKAILHLVNQMAHGQLYSIDGLSEFGRLSKIFK